MTVIANQVLERETAPGSDKFATIITHMPQMARPFPATTEALASGSSCPDFFLVWKKDFGLHLSKLALQVAHSLH